MRANAVRVDDLHAAVFKIASRINHSCSPNVIWDGMEANYRSCLEVRVCRDIEKGDELLASYKCFNEVSMFMTKEERARALKESWDFVCRCTLCTMTEEDIKENDKIRTHLNKLMELPPSLLKAKALLEQIRKIQDEVISILPLTLLLCYKESRAMGHFEESEAFKREARALSRKLGNYQEYTEMTGEMLEPK